MSSLRISIVAALAVVAVAGAGLAGAALSNSAGWVARVEGREIAEEEFVAELEELRANDQIFSGVLQQLGQERFPEGAVPAELGAAWLARRIQDELVAREADRRGLRVSAGDRATAEEALPGQWSPEVWKVFSSDFQAREIARFARRLALEAVLRPPVTEADLRAAYEEQKDQFLTACARHILVETLDEATALRERIDAGESFEDLAREHSIDPGSGSQGGDLGCQLRGSYVEPFDSTTFTAELGVVTEPVETQFGFHLIRVDRRDLAPFESVRDQLEQLLQEESAAEFESTMVAAQGDVHVDVNPRYGAYTPDDLTGRLVSPPEPPDPPDELPVGGEEPAGEPTLFGP
ncbi:MAG: peptidylprolyl isomerase [Actinobacteria bacterium]|nr:peptidylprolyl isomerase [Actinomycetota bacterium]